MLLWKSIGLGCLRTVSVLEVREIKGAVTCMVWPGRVRDREL